MKITALILLLLCVATIDSSAQSDFKPGYLITNLQDTLHGSIDYRSDLQMGQVCNFRPLGTGKEVVYYPESILSYRFFDGKYFISKKFGKKKSFFEFLFEGKLDILYLRDDLGDHYYLETADSGLVELPYEEGIRERNGAEYWFKSVKHIGLLKFYTRDAPQLQTTIENIDRPEHKGLIALAEKYHKLTAPKSAKGFYQKRYPLFKVDIEAVLGALQVPDVARISSGQNLCGGIIAHFWLPRINERVYVRTGFLYARLLANFQKISLLKLPLQVEYRLPLGRVQPMCAIGVSVHNPFFLSTRDLSRNSGFLMSTMLGVNITISKKINLNINLDLDYKRSVRFPILPVGVFSNTTTVGLLYKL